MIFVSKSYIMSLAILLISPIIIQNALATDIVIASGDIGYETKDANAGNRLRWDWQASASIIFSLTKASDPTSIIYKIESDSNSASIDVVDDSTYILLWLNPSNNTVTLTYSIHVDAGGGSLILPLIAVVIIIMITVIFIFVSRKFGGFR